jgi:hypothetical protein
LLGVAPDDIMPEIEGLLASGTPVSSEEVQTSTKCYTVYWIDPSHHKTVPKSSKATLEGQWQEKLRQWASRWSVLSPSQKIAELEHYRDQWPDGHPQRDAIDRQIAMIQSKASVEELPKRKRKHASVSC